MGNSPLTSLRHSDGDHSISYDIRLGGSAAINFPGRKVERDANGVTTEEAWQVSYKVDNSTCNLTLTKTKGKIDVKIADDEAPKDRYNFSVTVQTKDHYNSSVTVRDVEITDDGESKDRFNSSVTVRDVEIAGDEESEDGSNSSVTVRDVEIADDGESKDRSKSSVTARDVEITGDEESKDRFNSSVTVQDVEITGDEESNDHSNSSVTVQTAQATSNVDPNATSISFVVSYSTTRNLTTVTTTAQHGVTETTFDLYESGRWRGLTVCEWKKKCKDDENAYMGTVTHYFANADDEKGKNVGLSLAIKRIRVLDDGHLDFAVEGPQQHPVHALFFMFDEVRRTGTWKPPNYPHYNDIIQWQPGSFEQSHSEDSDGGSLRALSIVANNGRFEGNNNGNLIVRNLIIINQHPGR